MQHRAYYRVYRNVKLAAFKLHIAEHGFSVGIESLGREHVFVLVNVQFDAGVNIKGYDSCQSVGRAAAEIFYGEYACNYQYKHRSYRGEAAQGRCSFLFHVNYLSFLMVTRAEDIVQSVRNSVGNGRAELSFDAFVVFHLNLPPSQFLVFLWLVSTWKVPSQSACQVAPRSRGA